MVRGSRRLECGAVKPPATALFAAPLLRARVAAWLVLCLLCQGFVAVRHEVAMAAGFEVCSADGSRRVVDDEGRPVSDGAQAHHACCLLGDTAAPPPLARAFEGLAVVVAPAASVPVGRLAAEWAAPLSRGPPATA